MEYFFTAVIIVISVLGPPLLGSSLRKAWFIRKNGDASPQTDKDEPKKRLIQSALQRMFFKPRPPKNNGESKKDHSSFNMTDFTSKKEDPYAEK